MKHNDSIYDPRKIGLYCFQIVLLIVFVGIIDPIDSLSQRNLDTTDYNGKLISKIDTDKVIFVSNKYMPDIYESTNDIEIRFDIYHLPTIYHEQILLFYKNSIWNITVINNYTKSYQDTIYYFPNYTEIDSLIWYLNQGKIVKLKDQSQYKKVMQIFDGNRFRIDMKIGNKFKHLYFSNADWLAELYPKRKEYKQFSCILQGIKPFIK